MPRLASRDGTEIAYERSGSGPSVILVGGSLDDGAENAPLAAELSSSFSVFNYARRGRGESGDVQPYAVAREIEDLQALIAQAGGSAHVLGVSSGGALALEAAAAGAAISRLAVYEVPYFVPGLGKYAATVSALLAEDRRDDALETFMRVAGSSEEQIAGARSSEHWPPLVELAHTLAYDAACLGDGRPPAVSTPTLVLSGDDTFLSDQLAAALPHATREKLPGQGHVADPAVLAAALARFYGTAT